MARYIQYLLIFLLCLPSYNIMAQTLSGSVRDDAGSPIPQASIYIEELQQGASTAEDGTFHIKLPKGEYNFVFQCVGYTSVQQKIIVQQQGSIVNIVMPIKAYEIGAVVVAKSKEDYAYSIMRNVIGMAPYYASQVEQYKASVYIKGSMKIEKISRIVKALGGKEFRKTINTIGNNAILLESMNEISFRAPNSFHHRVISTNSSIPLDDFKGLNTMDFVNVNLYKLNFVQRDAFRNYKFTFMGATEDGGLTINKIRITPRTKNPVLVSGYIYILDGTWHIYSVDLAGDAKFGTYNVKGNCYQIRPDVYLPAVMNLDGTIDIMGNKMGMTYQLALKYNEVVLNNKVTNPLRKTSAAASSTSTNTNNIIKNAPSTNSLARRVKNAVNNVNSSSKSKTNDVNNLDGSPQNKTNDHFYRTNGQNSVTNDSFYRTNGQNSVTNDSFYRTNGQNKITNDLMNITSEENKVTNEENMVKNDIMDEVIVVDGIYDDADSIIKQPMTAAEYKKYHKDSIASANRMAKINSLLAKEELSDRDMARLAKLWQQENDAARGNSLDLTRDYKVDVDSGSRRMTADEWNAMRPVELSDEEAKSFARADSLRIVLADSAINDTTFKQKTKKIFNAVSKFFGGSVKFNNGKGRIAATILDPSSITFNSVDGLRYGIKGWLRHEDDSARRLNVSASLVWAFVRKAEMGDFSVEYNYLPQRRAKIMLSSGVMNRDFNYHQSPTDNEIMTAGLLTHNNYTRLYERFYFSVRHEIDIANGLVAIASVNYADKWKLENHSNFAYYFYNEQYFPNNNVHNSLLSDDFMLYNSAWMEAALIYTPRYYYRFRGRRKIMVRSDYPTITLHYKKAIPQILGSQSDYDYLMLGVNQRIPAGLMREFSYRGDVSWFLNRNKVDFADFIHFKSVGFPVNYVGSDPAKPRYKYASNDWGVMGEARYVSPLIMLKYLSKFNETYCRENVKWHGSYTPHAGFYNELHYSVSEILLFIELGVYAAFENLRFEAWGVSVRVRL